MSAPAPASPTVKTKVTTEVDFARPGKQIGFLRVPQSRNDSGWGIVQIPIVIVANGEGPTVLLTAGNHGDEYEGQVTLSNLSRALMPEEVRGRVIILPAMHLPAALAGSRMSPIDGRDFNRVFPGDPNGTFAQVLAHYVDAVLLPLCDFQMDLHSGGRSMDLVACTVCHVLDDPARMAASLAAANAFGAPVTMVLHEPDAGPTLLASAERRGIVALSSELGGLARVSPEGVRITERGVRNLLKHLGILPGAPEVDAGYGPSKVMTVPDFSHYVFAPAAGLYQPVDDLGATVRAGTLAGRLHFVEDPGRPPIDLHYAADGLLWAVRGSARVQAGDPVAVIAAPFAG